MSHRGRTHAAMMKGASKETIKNRKQKLFERMNRLIDNSSLQVLRRFSKGNLKALHKNLLTLSIETSK